MSTRYFIICLDCKRRISIVDRSFHGKCLTPETKRELPKFVITHAGHKIRLVSEYDEMEIDSPTTKEQKMIELMEWLKPYTPDERLEMLLEAARTTGIKELEQAIIEYWSDKDQKGIHQE